MGFDLPLLSLDGFDSWGALLPNRELLQGKDGAHDEADANPDNCRTRDRHAPIVHLVSRCASCRPGRNALRRRTFHCVLRQTRPLLRFPRTPWTLSWQTRRHSQPYYSVTLFLGRLWPLAMFQGAPHRWTLLVVRVLRSPGIVTSRSSPLQERLASSPSISWQPTE